MALELKSLFYSSNHLLISSFLQFLQVIKCSDLLIDRYNGLSAYGQSKLANVLHANELARRLKVKAVIHMYDG